MRTAPFATTFALAGLAGCLSAPTGRDPGAVDAPVDGTSNPWPPPGADIAAIAAGDLDGDGKDDLIVADVAGDRIHWLRGGGDIDPTRATVDTSTAAAPIPGLDRPVAIAVVDIGAARHVVVLDTPGSGPRVTVLDMQLRETGAATLTGVPMPQPDDVVSVNASTFGPQMNATFVTLPGHVFFIEGANIGLDPPGVMMLPPTGTTFADVVGATGYVGAPPMPQVVVAERERTQRADAGQQGMFTWSTIRPDTDADWPNQVFADLDDDSYPDLISFVPDAGGGDVCMVDVQAGTMPGCYAAPFSMPTARITTGSVAGMDQVDVLLTDARPAGNPSTNAFLITRLRVSGGNLAADVATMPYEVDVPEAMPAVLQLDSGPAEAILVGKNGGIACLRPTTGNMPMAPCAP